MKYSILPLALCLFSISAFASGEGDAPAVSTSASEAIEVSPAMSPAPAPAPAFRKQNTSFLVGQLYVGGHVGFSVPLGLGRKDEELAFNDVAKTGFVIYADCMKQMNQAIGLGGEVGYRRYGQNDKKTWGTLTRYGNFDATYQAIDFDLTGRVFIGRQSIRPYIGILAGGELVMNSMDFTPNSAHSNLDATVYKTTNVSVLYGVMAGAYFKAGKRTLLSISARLSFVPTLDDGLIEITESNGDTQHIYKNMHGNQHNISVTVGMHIGTQKNNKH